MKHTIKTSNNKTQVIEKYTRGRAIKLMCTECGGWGEMQPKDCQSKNCPLYPYRGKSTLAYEPSQKKGN